MTMSDLFPGNMGRMLLIRVMIRLKRPDLATMDPTQKLDQALIKMLKVAKLEVARG